MSNGGCPACGNKYYGKYRGKVLENVDPEFLGRIIPEVADVPGSMLNWAMPCTPYAGFEVGFYAIPPIGANVWIEYEGGDPSFPIWAGCFWAEGEVPLEAPPPETKIFKTEFITMVLNDVPEEGGFILECIEPAVNTPLSMLFNSEGIQIICGDVTIVMTPESISLTVPESNINMTPETITITVPPSTITMTGEAIEAESADINVTATADISMEASAGVELNAGGDLEMAAGGAAELSGGGDVTVDAGGAAEMTAGGDASVSAGGAAEVLAGGAVAIDAGAAVEIAAAADASITSATTMITSVLEINGDALLDGLQVLAI
jgi:hypothetical protein